ncbi:hypothetical protein IDH44_20915 [Paenibacillus sp. IB182496]|uniref:GAF domain-containing protein n=1 Tax=Paenibacillus sabuli TaxID=2772509 RepID=A0A927BXY8_9BACL|nr:hypothetical protein [Paenibacillus sabuli]MBD2847660.1 hypothetical protein [Paenibacillus sabuli]
MKDRDVSDLGAYIEEVRQRTASDFAALALPLPGGGRYSWQYASGNLNMRYRQMLVRRGKGLPGRALLLDRLVVWDGNGDAGEGHLGDSPIVLAERLLAAAALPLPLVADRRAVLLAGLRTPGCELTAWLLELAVQADRLTARLGALEAIEPRTGERA